MRVEDVRPVPDARVAAAALGVNLAVEATAARMATLLRAARVPSILLKGPPLVRWLYGTEAARFSDDVDLLVPPAAIGAAEGVLAQRGFAPFSTIPGDRPKHARLWEHDESPVGVDLHINLAGVTVSAEEAWEVLSGETEEIAVGGARVDVLAPAARAMHVALHASQHGANLLEHPVRDLERALAVLPPEIWTSAAALAARLGARPAFAAGLSLVSAGEELRARLGLSDPTSVEVALRARTPPDLALGLEWLARTPGLRAKARFVGHKLFPPRTWMRSSVPVARRGALGLVAAYAWRPAWLLVRMPPAFRAWRRARADTTTST